MKGFNGSCGLLINIIGMLGEQSITDFFFNPKKEKANDILKILHKIENESAIDLIHNHNKNSRIISLIANAAIDAVEDVIFGSEIFNAKNLITMKMEKF